MGQISAKEIAPTKAPICKENGWLWYIYFCCSQPSIQISELCGDDSHRLETTAKPSSLFVGIGRYHFSTSPDFKKLLFKVCPVCLWCYAVGWNALDAFITVLCKSWMLAMLGEMPTPPAACTKPDHGMFACRYPDPVLYDSILYLDSFCTVGLHSFP